MSTHLCWTALNSSEFTTKISSTALPCIRKQMRFSLNNGGIIHEKPCAALAMSNVRYYQIRQKSKRKEICLRGSMFGSTLLGNQRQRLASGSDMWQTSAFCPTNWKNLVSQTKRIAWCRVDFADFVAFQLSFEFRPIFFLLSFLLSNLKYPRKLFSHVWKI